MTCRYKDIPEIDEGGPEGYHLDTRTNEQWPGSVCVCCEELQNSCMLSWNLKVLLLLAHSLCILLLQVDTNVTAKERLATHAAALAKLADEINSSEFLG